MARPLLAGFLLLSACGSPRIRMPGPVHHLAQAEPDQDLEETHAAEPDVEVEVAAQSLAQEEDDTKPSRRTLRHGPSADIAKQASKLVGKKSVVVKGESYRRDCSGFVCGVYAGAGIPLSGSSRDLYAQAKAAGVLHKRKDPEIGDIAFFDNTYDRNRNGRRDDPLSHVAVVEAIADDGTVVLVHYGSKGVARISMDLRAKDTFYDQDGVLRNSILRSGGKGEKLTGELFVAWGSLWKVASES